MFRRGQVFILCGFFVLGGALCPGNSASSAYADPPRVLIPKRELPQRKPDRSLKYTGAFWSLGGFVGMTIRGNRAFGKGVGYLVGLQGRLSMVLHIVGFELLYAHSGYKLSRKGNDIRVFRNTFGGSVYIHPLFFLMTENRWLYYAMSTFYVNVGVGLELTSLKSAAYDVKKTEVDWALRWGFGIDIPLDNIHDGSAFWLGAAYQQVRLRANTGVDTITDMLEHWLLITFSYRMNGL